MNWYLLGQFRSNESLLLTQELRDLLKALEPKMLSQVTEELLHTD